MRAVLFNDTSTEKHIGSNLVMHNIRSLCAKNNIILVDSYTRKQIEQDSITIRQFIESNDIELIIVNGEGSLHRCPRFFNVILTIIPPRVKTVLINSLWEQMILKHAQSLNQFSLISVRESFSYNELYNIYPEERVIVTPDIIFYSELEDCATGYGDSVMTGLLNILQTHPNYFPLNYIDNFPSPVAYFNWLQSLDLYITGRFHGVCLAAMANVPFLTFASNSHKIEGLLKDMHCQDLLIQSFEEVEAKKVRAKELASKAHKYAVAAKPKIETLFQRIAQL